MASTISRARSWPPAPTVEDEADSLLHEVFEDGSPVAVKKDDTSVVSRGTVDQNPIIIPAEEHKPNTSQPRLGPKNDNMKGKTEHKKSRPVASPALSRASSTSSKTKNRVRFAEPTDRIKNYQPVTEDLPPSSKYCDRSRRDNGSSVLRSSTHSPNRQSHAPRRQTQDYGDYPSDSDDDIDQNSRRYSWTTWEEGRDGDAAYVKERMYEWHSDDEVSSYQGTKFQHRRESSRVVTETISSESSPVLSASHAHDIAQASRQDRYLSEPSHGGSRSASRHRRSALEEVPRKDYKEHHTSRARSNASSTRRPANYGSDFEDMQSQVTPRSPAIRSKSTSRPRSSTIQTINTARLLGDSPSFSLRPCPRPIALAGYRDWYTISGLDHLDICPSCTSQLGNTRFRELLVPSRPKHSETNVRCSLSQPWAQLAIAQTMKMGLNHLELLYQVTRPPTGGQPCSGREYSLQTWYRVVDPETGRCVPEFHACSACFRNLSILMPSLTYTFSSEPIVQERICDLRVDSSRFTTYVEKLQTAVTRSLPDPHRYIDLRDFIHYVQRKKTRYHCPRDHMLVASWHFIPDLPEFTICEDCYDDVVRPIANSPIANKISRSLKKLPCADRSRRDQPASCYLYSPRMRAKFREAVRRGDYEYLQSVVLRRYDTETGFRQMKKLLLQEVAKGFDHDQNLRRNAEAWKRLE